MNLRTRAVSLAASAVAVLTFAAPAAHANVLSLVFEGCGNQPASQPFAQFGDDSDYTLVPGGTFEPGTTPWLLTGGASVVSGNETFYVNSPSDSHSLSLPTGSSAISPASCTSLAHPTVRFFLRNTGSSSSRLEVTALYPGLIGGVSETGLGELSGSSSWEPSPALGLTLSNLLATLSLDQTVIAFEFTPVGKGGDWGIDDVYLDPFSRG
jgi:hypothetical protein